MKEPDRNLVRSSPTATSSHRREQSRAGAIPEDWEVRSLGDIASFRTGPFGSALHKSDYVEDGIPLINPMHIVGDCLSPDSETSVSEQAAKRLSDYRMRNGDVVIGRRGEMGRCAVVQESQEGWLCGTGSLIIRLVEDVDATFVQRVLTTKRVVNAITRASVGSTMVNLNQSALSRLPIQLPSLSEQRAIMEALSDVDGLLGSLDALIAKKQAIKQATMQQLLTGRTRLPGFSGLWATKRLGDVGRFRSGSGFPTKLQGAAFGEYPLYKVSDMNSPENHHFMVASNNYISESVRQQLGATAFPAMSIVFAKIGAAIYLERKKLLTRTSCLDNNMAAFVIDDGAVNHRFMHCVFLALPLGDFVSTTAVPSLDGKTLSAIEVQIPSLDEQCAIATSLSDMDAEIDALERRREKTSSIKQGMMQQLLTGRVRLSSAMWEN